MTVTLRAGDGARGVRPVLLSGLLLALQILVGSAIVPAYAAAVSAAVGATPSAQPPAPSPPGVGLGGLAGLPAAIARDACHGQRDSFLTARLRGAASLNVDWHGTALRCDGAMRGDGRGMRVTFSGTDRRHRLLFIFGFDAAARRADLRNVATNVTVIFEGEQRLYSTRGTDRCSVDALQTRPLPVQGGEHLLAVRARGFCIAPASAMGNGAPLLVSRFDFSGAIFLEAAPAQHEATGGAARSGARGPAHSTGSNPS